MSDILPRAELRQAEWRILALRVNELVQATGPSIVANELGIEADARSRQLMSLGMHIEEVCEQRLRVSSRALTNCRLRSCRSVASWR